MSVNVTALSASPNAAFFNRLVLPMTRIFSSNGRYEERGLTKALPAPLEIDGFVLLPHVHSAVAEFCDYSRRLSKQPRLVPPPSPERKVRAVSGPQVGRISVDGDGSLVAVNGGLPTWIDGITDTRCIAAHGSAAALADRGGSLYISTDTGRSWSRQAGGLPTPSSVLII